MKSLKLSGTVAPEDLKGIVGSVSSEIENFINYSLNGTDMTIVGAGKYFLRTNDRIGMYLISASSSIEQRIDVSSVGGGGGLFNLSLGSKQRYEEELVQALENFLKNNGIIFETIE